MPIDFSSNRPVYLQIADDLRDQIDQGRYRPEDKLPSRKEMAAQYGVAPETVKKALDVLVRDDLVMTQSTRGTFVLKKPEEPAPSPEFLHLMDQLKALAGRVDDLEARIEELGAPRRGRRRAAPDGRGDPTAD